MPGLRRCSVWRERHAVKGEERRRHHLDGVVVELGGDAAALDLLGLQHAREDLAAASFAVRQRPLGGDAIGHVHEHAPDLVHLVRPVPDREHSS